MVKTLIQRSHPFRYVFYVTFWLAVCGLPMTAFAHVDPANPDHAYHFSEYTSGVKRAAMTQDGQSAQQNPPSPSADVTPSASSGKPSAEVMALAREVMMESGMDGSLDAIDPALTEQMSKVFASLNPNRDGEISQVVHGILTPVLARQRPVLMTAITTLIATHYTVEELKAIQAFYKTPVGRKMVAKGPQIVAESTKVGAAWGEQIARDTGPKIIAALKAKGLVS